MLRTRFFVLAFLLHFFPPSASIDGGPAFKIRWGDTICRGCPRAITASGCGSGTSSSATAASRTR